MVDLTPRLGEMISERTGQPAFTLVPEEDASLFESLTNNHNQSSSSSINPAHQNNNNNQSIATASSQLASASFIGVGDHQHQQAVHYPCIHHHDLTTVP